MRKPLALMIVAATLAASGSAWAAVILPGSETSLQTILNNITVAPDGTLGGPSSVAVNSDQVIPDGRWMVTGTGNASATMIIEIAGYANINTFGVYNRDNFAPLFTGPAVAGDRAFLSIYDTGRITVFRPYNMTYTEYNNFLDGNDFGFYLQTADGIKWFSEDARNSDRGDHMVAFQGTGDAVRLPSGYTGTWTAYEYILAWEDLGMTVSDRDYNDMVVMVESVKPVPEPGAMVLIGSGLIGLAAYGRRKTRK